MTQSPADIEWSSTDLMALGLRDLRHRDDSEMTEGLRRVLSGIDDPDSRLIGGIRNPLL
ncbi:hypothetical protein [Parafrankia discariae]|uniref:hypothetical protein n=1 Tax=Parafrankia discariae TaxID=365528 RepID=UPI0003A1415B|nr:hypothetical protein [Parafrankia discariae]